MKTKNVLGIVVLISGAVVIGSALVGHQGNSVAAGFRSFSSARHTLSGIQATSKNPTASYSSLSVASGISAEYVSSKSDFVVSLTGDTDLLKNVVVDVVDGELMIGWAPGSWLAGPVQAKITGPAGLKAITCSGGAGFKTSAQLPELTKIQFSGGSQGDFAKLNIQEATVSGGSHVQASELQSESCEFNLTGCARFTASIGHLGSVNVKESGGSDLDLGGLKIGSAVVSSHGASRLEANVTDTVSGKLSGASSINLTGSPKHEDISASGASHVIHN